VARERFFSKFLEGGSSLSGTFLGEIIDFSRRMAESAIFNWGIYWIMEAWNWAPYGTPSYIPDQG